MGVNENYTFECLEKCHTVEIRLKPSTEHQGLDPICTDKDGKFRVLKVHVCVLLFLPFQWVYVVQFYCGRQNRKKKRSTKINYISHTVPNFLDFEPVKRSEIRLNPLWSVMNGAWHCIFSWNNKWDKNRE